MSDEVCPYLKGYNREQLRECIDYNLKIATDLSDKVSEMTREIEALIEKRDSLRQISGDFRNYAKRAMEELENRIGE